MSNKIETVPNQHVFVIHREDKGSSFIAINKHNFSKAYRDMSSTPSALGLYIWLVGNQDKYRFAFSPQAIENQMGMARSSCHGAVKKLEDLGYLLPREDSNICDFYEVTTKDNKMNRKLVEAEMLNFEDMPSQSETEESFPRAKQGDFQF